MTTHIATIDRSALIRRMIPNSVDYARVSQQELQASLRDVSHAIPITLSALTIPTYRKTNCPFKNDIIKFSRVNGFLNFDYQRSVNNQREREDKKKDFEPMPRAWGTHLENTPFISNVTKDGRHNLHLKFKVQKTLSTAYFTLSGRDLSESIVEPFLPEQNKGHRQGVDKQIIERDYKVDNLLTIAYNGIGYLIV